MFRITIILVLFVFVFANLSSAVTFKTGADLLEACQHTDDKKVTNCLGYITGVHDGMLYAKELGPQNSSVCVQPGVSAVDLKFVVERYLVRHPEQHHYGASGLVFWALYETFPCQ